MPCQVCGENNPAEARFCGKCGAVLPGVETSQPALVITETIKPYAGFSARFGAAIIDNIIIFAASSMLEFGSLYLPYFSYFSNTILYWLYFWLFTGLSGRTPGKMAFGLKVVDAQGKRPSLSVGALREIIGKTISTLLLFIGFFWIIWDKEKRGWHDVIAGTRVVKVTR